MKNYRNTVHYTTTGSDGTRHEQSMVIDRPRVLTSRGSERIINALRKLDGQAPVVVVRVESIPYW